MSASLFVMDVYAYYTGHTAGAARRYNRPPTRIGHYVKRLLSLLGLLFFIGTAVAQTFKPTPGMPGKDVVWIPTPNHAVEKMLDMAKVTAQDFVIDLGSGDGRNLIAAAKRGARAHGVEYNPDLVEYSRRAAAQAGVADKVTIVQGDMFAADISQATVMMLFLLPNHLNKLAPTFLKLRPGTRIVSNTYEIGGGWEPDVVEQAQPCLSWCSMVMYVVPARAAGSWRLGEDEWLWLEQRYQELFGTYRIGGVDVAIENGRLLGEEIRFTVNQVEYVGRVSGNSMSGSAKGRVSREWRATRTSE
ncbi:MAG: class I SAM-dependent methyltransferase [Betaproteobacteria bacterium]|nr:class I SAM-dependent methyltransferase [Betaproteobacteria bacterium]